MEVVHVLRDDRHVEIFLEFGDDLVRAVGLRLFELVAPFVVELEHQAGIAVPAVNVGHVGHVVVFPKTVAVAEGLDSALGTHAGTGKDDEFFHVRQNNSCGASIQRAGR